MIYTSMFQITQINTKTHVYNYRPIAHSLRIKLALSHFTIRVIRSNIMCVVMELIWF